MDDFVCLDPFYIVNYYIKWAKTSWVFSRMFRSGVQNERYQDSEKIVI